MYLLDYKFRQFEIMLCSARHPLFVSTRMKING
jgi:hypothetical protein